MMPPDVLSKERAPSKRAKPNKYKNKPCKVGDEKYRSQKERDRHQALLLLERAGHIDSLRREVAFELAPAVVIQGRRRPPLRYIADYVYMQREATGIGWRKVVEDCKGVRTEGYRVKRHLMKAVHGIEILET